MSDALRQDTTDKVKSTVKPDSEKSTLEKGQDSVKSTADSVAGSLQPEGDKSTTQKATDSASSTADSASEQGKSVLGQAQDTLSNAAGQAQEALGLNKK